MTYGEFQKQFSIFLNPQQEAAVRAAEGVTLLLAVPGSGKTTVLVVRLGYLIYCRGVRPEEILTMTYTVAAAADMRRRFASLFGKIWQTDWNSAPSTASPPESSAGMGTRWDAERFSW